MRRQGFFALTLIFTGAVFFFTWPCLGAIRIWGEKHWTFSGVYGQGNFYNTPLWYEEYQPNPITLELNLWGEGDNWLLTGYFTDNPDASGQNFFSFEGDKQKIYFGERLQDEFSLPETIQPLETQGVYASFVNKGKWQFILGERKMIFWEDKLTLSGDHNEYALTYYPVLVNSEKVTVEGELLISGQDYTMDYAKGIIHLLHQPAAGMNLGVTYTVILEAREKQPVISGFSYFLPGEKWTWQAYSVTEKSSGDEPVYFQDFWQASQRTNTGFYFNVKDGSNTYAGHFSYGKQENPTIIMIDDFEDTPDYLPILPSFEEPQVWGDPIVSAGSQVSLSKVSYLENPTGVKIPPASLGITYVLPPGGTGEIIYPIWPGEEVSYQDGLELWLSGDGSPVRITFVLEDISGTQYSYQTTVNWRGYPNQPLEINFSENLVPSPAGDFTIKSFHVIVENPNALPLSGQVFLDGIRLKKKQASLERWQTATSDAIVTTTMETNYPIAPFPTPIDNHVFKSKFQLTNAAGFWQMAYDWDRQINLSLYSQISLWVYSTAPGEMELSLKGGREDYLFYRTALIPGWQEVTFNLSEPSQTTEMANLANITTALLSFRLADLQGEVYIDEIALHTLPVEEGYYLNLQTDLSQTGRSAKWNISWLTPDYPWIFAGQRPPFLRSKARFTRTFQQDRNFGLELENVVFLDEMGVPALEYQNYRHSLELVWGKEQAYQGSVRFTYRDWGEIDPRPGFGTIANWRWFTTDGNYFYQFQREQRLNLLSNNPLLATSFAFAREIKKPGFSQKYSLLWHDWQYENDTEELFSLSREVSTQQLRSTLGLRHLDIFNEDAHETWELYSNWWRNITPWQIKMNSSIWQSRDDKGEERSGIFYGQTTWNINPRNTLETLYTSGRGLDTENINPLRTIRYYYRWLYNPSKLHLSFGQEYNGEKANPVRESWETRLQWNWLDPCENWSGMALRQVVNEAQVYLLHSFNLLGLQKSEPWTWTEEFHYLRKDYGFTGRLEEKSFNDGWKYAYNSKVDLICDYKLETKDFPAGSEEESFNRHRFGQGVEWRPLEGWIYTVRVFEGSYLHKGISENWPEREVICKVDKNWLMGQISFIYQYFHGERLYNDWSLELNMKKTTDFSLTGKCHLHQEGSNDIIYLNMELVWYF